MPENMERLGIIRHSGSPWASPLHYGSQAWGWVAPMWRLSRLNKATIPNRYPVPHIPDFSAHLLDSVVFSKVDLVRGYHQVPVQPLDIPETALITSFRLFEFLRMPFGRYEALKGKAIRQAVDWTKERKLAFVEAKAALASATMLAHPSPKAPIAITTDASDYAVGAVHDQWVKGAWQPLAFFSR